MRVETRVCARYSVVKEHGHVARTCHTTFNDLNDLHCSTTNLLAASALDTAPALRLGPEARNGAERDRTADPLLAKQVLSQLSYSPARDQKLDYPTTERPELLELLQTKSNRENQPPRSLGAGIRACVALPAVGVEWWAYLESNQGPHAYQACALTI